MNWPQFQFDAGNTGYYPDTTGPAESITEQWQLTTGVGIRSSPAVVGDTVYVGSYDGHLYAIDATDGSEQWQFPTPSGPPRS